MLSATPSEASANNRVQVSVEGATATDFIGKRAVRCDHPLAFLVNGPPGYVIPAHFHEIDQYQIFVGGSATLGKHDVLPGSIHYADAYTPYGPIVAEDDGFAYLTLRPVSSTGYHEMPGAAPLVKEQSHRARPARPDDGGRRRHARTAEDRHAAVVRTAGRRRRLSAECRAPRGNSATGNSARRGPHDFVVLDGEVTAGGRTYQPRSCIWIDAGEPGPAMVAGAAGAVVAFMSFAKRAA